jgi:hypothetical protein
MGEGSPSAKLTEEQVREIRDLSKALTTSQLAEKFNMSRGGIYGVVSGTNWSHVI